MRITAGRGLLIGIILAQGAPLGWFALRRLFPETDLRALTYAYLIGATSVVLGAIGWVMGLWAAHLQRLNRRLRELALEDELTGLANARAFHDELDREVARAERSGHDLSLVLADLDHFKRVNDERGHLTGDRVLAGIGRLLAEHSRDADVAARYGGEEFAIILPGTGLAEAKQIAERLRREVEGAEPNGKLPLHLTASFGVTSRRTGETPVTFFARADQALYKAKRAGRNCVRAIG